MNSSLPGFGVSAMRVDTGTGEISPTVLSNPASSKAIKLNPLLVNELHVRALAWDLRVIKMDMVRKGTFALDEVDVAEREYKRYIALSFAYLGIATPISKRVDDFWHAHILFTEDYADMCEHIGGHFLHHRPGILDEGLPGGAYDRRMALYRASFGTPDPKWWNDVSIDTEQVSVLTNELVSVDCRNSCKSSPGCEKGCRSKCHTRCRPKCEPSCRCGNATR
jgi:hypothetical protein